MPSVVDSWKTSPLCPSDYVQPTEQPLYEVDLMIPVTYGYARVSKTDDATRNLETQLHIL